MKTEEKVTALEYELKLMKEELKQTLLDVQNFLHGIELPPSPDEVFGKLDVDGGGGSGGGMQAMSLETNSAAHKHNLETGGDTGSSVSETRETPSSGKSEQVAVPLASLVKEPSEEPKDKSRGEPEEESSGESEKESQQEIDQEQSNKQEVNQSKLHVNLLANLIRWVSMATKMIGSEQLSTLLDVYSTTGYLCPELKQVILHLGNVIIEPSEDVDTRVWERMIKEQLSRFLEVYSVTGQITPELKEGILHLVDTTAQLPREDNKADVWSRLILELHGILTVDGIPVRFLKPSWSEEQDSQQEDESSIDEENPDDRGIKLRFALPIDGGGE